MTTIISQTLMSTGLRQWCLWLAAAVPLTAAQPRPGIAVRRTLLLY